MKHESDQFSRREFVRSLSTLAAGTVLALAATTLTARAAAPQSTDLGIKEAQFTLNGAPTFLLGISYYGALGASEDFIRRDLDDTQRYGFNWIRVFATWDSFGDDASAIDGEGNPREPFLGKLKWLVAECDRRGVVVDVTLTRGDGTTGTGRLKTFAAHRRALETLVAALKPHRNWYLDIANERNVRDARFVSFEELKQLRETVKRLDPQRLVTASDGEISRDDMRAYLRTAEVDFVCPHRPRHPQSPGQTEAKSREYLAWMKDIGRVVPLHYQEPFRRGFGKWEPPAEAFLTDLSQAQTGGAAGWCFHNGSQGDKTDGKPRRSFDLRERRLFDQLDEEERKVLAGLLLRGRKPSQATPQQPATTTAKGPLRVHPNNPRYFTDGSGKAVYLTGSHTWNNLQDIEGFKVGGSPDALSGTFDFNRYLDFLQSYHHNFFRLWFFEFAWEPSPKYNFTVSPHPWLRTGPGNARDGKPRFDLSRFNESYFERLRARVTAARDRGIYVSIMLFESSFGEEAWEGHPFHPDNNVNGVDGRGMVPFHIPILPEVVRLQEAYVRQVVDTVNDLDNVLYEVCNEPGAEAKDWQVYFCNYIKKYEATKPRSHPVGLTAIFDKFHWPPWVALNNLLFNSPADWISPGGWAKDERSKVWGVDPPANDGRKVVIPDPDHIWPVAPQRAWVWKCFVRGHQPILMDWYDAKPVWISSEEQEAMRKAMGHTWRYAGKMNLATMTPRNDLASTQYCLANPGQEYLVYLPEGGEVMVDLSAATGALGVEWFNPATGETVAGSPMAGGDKQEFVVPFAGDAVLYIMTK